MKTYTVTIFGDTYQLRANFADQKTRLWPPPLPTSSRAMTERADRKPGCRWHNRKGDETMKFRLTIPNDCGSRDDYAALAEWCRQHECPEEEAAVFERALAVWRDAEPIEVEDWSRICEAPAAPPANSAEWPPLWITRERL